MGQKKGSYTKVAENLWRYSTSKKYFAVYRSNGRIVWKSLKTTDPQLAKRLLRDELSKVEEVDYAASKMLLGGLLSLYEKSLHRFDHKTRATRESIVRTFRRTWPHGFNIAVRDVNAAQLELWLAEHRKRMKKVSLNEYIRVLRHMFALAVDSKVIAQSPAAGFKLHRPEEPIRNTPTRQQFEAVVNCVRTNRFSDHAQDTADLIEFMGLAGVGMAECGNLLGEHIDFTATKSPSTAQRPTHRLYNSTVSSGKTTATAAKGSGRDQKWRTCF